MQQNRSSLQEVAFTDPPYSVFFDITENYDNGTLLNLSVNGTAYVFDFTTQEFTAHYPSDVDDTSTEVSCVGDDWLTYTVCPSYIQNV